VNSESTSYIFCPFFGDSIKEKTKDLKVSKAKLKQILMIAVVAIGAIVVVKRVPAVNQYLGL
jgi:hypothetical protein